MESVCRLVSVWLKRRDTSAAKVCAQHAHPHRGPGLVHTAEGHMARDLGVLGGMSRGHPGACVHSHSGRSHRRLDGDPSPWAAAPPRLPLPSALPALCLLASVPAASCSALSVCLQFQLLQRSWLSPSFSVSPLGLLPLSQGLIPRPPALTGSDFRRAVTLQGLL